MFHLSHCLKSDVPFGTYTDKVYLIESCLFEALSNYVSKDGEDAFKYQDLNDDEAMHVDKYREMIKILHFYHIELPELNKKMDECMDNRTGKIVFTDVEGESGYTELKIVYENDEEEKKSFEALEDSIKLEEEIHEKTTENLKKIVELRGYMWT